MKRLLCILVCTLCVLSLLGCSEESQKNAISTFLVDASAMEDFMCDCLTDHGAMAVIEMDSAKEIYAYITQQWKLAEETERDYTQQDFISLSFRDSDAYTGLIELDLVVTGQVTLEEIATELDTVEQHFFGDFRIFENDYMAYRYSPVVSSAIWYKLPEGTYNQVLALINENIG